MFTGSCLLSDLLNKHWYLVKPKVVKRNKVEEKLGITVYIFLSILFRLEGATKKIYKDTKKHGDALSGEIILLFYVVCTQGSMTKTGLHTLVVFCSSVQSACYWHKVAYRRNSSFISP